MPHLFDGAVELLQLRGQLTGRSVFPDVGPATAPFDEPRSGDVHLVPVLQAGFLDESGDVEEPVGDPDEVVAYPDASASVFSGRVYDDGLIRRHRASVPSARLGCAVGCASWGTLLGVGVQLRRRLSWSVLHALRPEEVVKGVVVACRNLTCRISRLVARSAALTTKFRACLTACPSSSRSQLPLVFPRPGIGPVRKDEAVLPYAYRVTKYDPPTATGHFVSTQGERSDQPDSESWPTIGPCNLSSPKPVQAPSPFRCCASQSACHRMRSKVFWDLSVPRCRRARAPARRRGRSQP